MKHFFTNKVRIILIVAVLLAIGLAVISGLTNLDLLHNGEKVTGFSYDAETGKLKFTISTFGIYDIVYGTDAVASADELVKALNDGRSVRLTQNIDLGEKTVTIPAGKNVTLNLNGFDIAAAQQGTTLYGTFNILPGATMNVEGMGNVNLTANVTTGISVAIFQNDGTLNIYGGSYTATQAASVDGLGAVIAVIDNCAQNNDAEVNIYGGTFTLAGIGAKNVIRNWPIKQSSVKLNIYGGTFNANKDVETTYIWNKNDGNKDTTSSLMNFQGGIYNGHIVCEDYDGHDDITIASGVKIEMYPKETN